MDLSHSLLGLLLGNIIAMDSMLKKEYEIMIGA